MTKLEKIGLSFKHNFDQISLVETKFLIKFNNYITNTNVIYHSHIKKLILFNNTE